MTNDQDIANIANIAEVLISHGDMYYGNDPLGAAREWDSYGFTPDGVDLWCSAKVWDPSVANALHRVGMSVKALRDTSATMIEVNGANAYTNGCPIYACCNGDISSRQIIEAYLNR